MEREKRICLRSRDFDFIMYLSEYGIITNENVKLFYDSKYYYKNRLASLAKGEFIERVYGKVVLGRKGKSYLNKIGLGYRNINRNETYKKRMERISDVSCKVQLSGWYFEPSWRCNINTFTKRGNRFIGVMSREKRHWGESDEDYCKRSYIVYFLHREITPRELKYIDKEINRNKSQFNGLIVFTEDEKYLYNPKFEKIRYKESYIIPYNKKEWEIFEIIKNEKFMNNKVREIFGDKLISLKAKSFFEEYYIKENNTYTYIFYMPFANFYLMDYLNYLATDDFHLDVKVKVVCFYEYVEYIRKYLGEEIEIISISFNKKFDL